MARFLVTYIQNYEVEAESIVDAYSIAADIVGCLPADSEGIDVISLEQS